MPPANTTPPPAPLPPPPANPPRQDAITSLPVLSALFLSGMLFCTAAMIDRAGARVPLAIPEPAITGEAIASTLPPTPEAPPLPEFRLLHLGDAMFDRGVRAAIARGEHPLTGLSQKLDAIGAELVVLNLEGPVTDFTECQVKAYSFRFDTTIPAALRNAGIDAVNLANNHSFDCFSRGLADTREIAGASLVAFGGFRPSESVATTTVSGLAVALIGIDATISAVPIQEYQELIASLASTTDIQIVSIHWGIEYELKESEAQTHLAHAFVDAGADAVFGHHPHVVQPVEVYNGAPIFYSLGNFIFDQTDPETKRGLGAEVTFDRSGATALTLHPLEIARMTPTFFSNDLREVACALINIKGAERVTPCSLEL